MNRGPQCIHLFGHLNLCIYDHPLFGPRTNCEEEVRDQIERMSTRSLYTSVQICVYKRTVPASTLKHTRAELERPQTNESQLALGLEIKEL